jgi:predicted ArsR family transcriptional regulator
MTEREEAYHAALASPTRRRVLEVLREAAAPQDAAAIGQRLGLHVTTARFHLDQLVTAGLAERGAGAEQRRGRPRMLYRPAGAARDDDARIRLIEVLADALARDDDGARRAVRAGERWGETFPRPDARDPAPGLVAALDRLGFGPERVDATPDAAIRLHACPFREAAREHPEVVCSVHRGLVEQLLTGTDAAGRLVPFVAPELCVVQLSRRAG